MKIGNGEYLDARGRGTIAIESLTGYKLTVVCSWSWSKPLKCWTTTWKWFESVVWRKSVSSRMMITKSCSKSRWEEKVLPWTCWTRSKQQLSSWKITQNYGTTRTFVFMTKETHNRTRTFSWWWYTLHERKSTSRRSSKPWEEPSCLWSLSV